MRPDLFQSIRWRLVASYVLLAFLSISIVGVLASEIMQRYMRQQEVRELRANAESIAQQLAPLMENNTSLPQIHSLAEAASFLGDVRVRVVDLEGFILADTGTPDNLEELLLVWPPERSGGNTPLDEALFNLVMPDWETSLPVYAFETDLQMEQPSGTTFQFIQRATGPWGGRITFRVPDSESGNRLFHQEAIAGRSENSVRQSIGSQREPLGYVEISAGQDLSAATLETLQRSFLIAGGGAVLAAVLLGLWMSHRLTSPLRELKETTGKMAAGDLAVRSDYQYSDEIGDLSRQFNQMAEQLQKSFSHIQSERDTLRRFISDASHELRTPVTALKNFITLLQGPAAGDNTARTEFLAGSETQIEQLEWITSNLLDLTRLDAGLEVLEIEEHEISALLEKSAAPFISRAESGHINLVVYSPDPAFLIKCDGHRMELVLGNLLDNALKFTPPGGAIELGAEQTPQESTIWVRDTGIGIAPEELPRIFDRFYRGRQATSGGSGLGLAIAKSLVEAQNGLISAESTPGEGSQFTIRFPTSTT
jgi:signal transduction histidine kinase